MTTNPKQARVIEIQERLERLASSNDSLVAQIDAQTKEYRELMVELAGLAANANAAATTVLPKAASGG